MAARPALALRLLESLGVSDPGGGASGSSSDAAPLPLPWCRTGDEGGPFKLGEDEAGLFCTRPSNSPAPAPPGGSFFSRRAGLDGAAQVGGGGAAAPFVTAASGRWRSLLRSSAIMEQEAARTKSMGGEQAPRARWLCRKLATVSREQGTNDRGGLISQPSLPVS
jgi:hypothetical protein